MTVICQGHVVSLSQSGNFTGGMCDAPDWHAVAIKIRLESRRCDEEITIHARSGEADAYRPGMQVELRLIPAHK